LRACELAQVTLTISALVLLLLLLLPPPLDNVAFIDARSTLIGAEEGLAEHVYVGGREVARRSAHAHGSHAHLDFLGVGLTPVAHDEIASRFARAFDTAEARPQDLRDDAADRTSDAHRVADVVSARVHVASAIPADIHCSAVGVHQ
jgi:hypothetical protein